MASALSQVVGSLESSNGANNASQPAAMANPTYGQYTGFVSQYGSGAAGVDNYASQVLANNPNATLGDFYASYVTNTGNPANTTSLAQLQVENPDAYNNLINNAGFNPSTPLSSLVETSNLSNGPTDASSGLAAGSTSYVNPLSPDYGIPSSISVTPENAAFNPSAIAAASSPGGGGFDPFGLGSVAQAIDTSFTSLIQGIEDWFTRGFLIVIGLTLFIVGILMIGLKKAPAIVPV